MSNTDNLNSVSAVLCCKCRNDSGINDDAASEHCCLVTGGNFDPGRQDVRLIYVLLYLYNIPVAEHAFQSSAPARKSTETLRSSQDAAGQTTDIATATANGDVFSKSLPPHFPSQPLSRPLSIHRSRWMGGLYSDKQKWLKEKEGDECCWIFGHGDKQVILEEFRAGNN